MQLTAIAADCAAGTPTIGVYRCGFARTQAAYDTATDELYQALDMVEEKLVRSIPVFNEWGGTQLP